MKKKKNFGHAVKMSQNAQQIATKYHQIVNRIAMWNT